MGKNTTSRYSGPSFPRLMPSPFNNNMPQQQQQQRPAVSWKGPAKMSIGRPIEVLQEAQGYMVTRETITGEVYPGKLIEAEDNMNCQMSNITVTYRDGPVAQPEQVYICDTKIRFPILPNMLKNAPVLENLKNKNQGSRAGQGKAAILKAQVAARGRGHEMGPWKLPEAKTVFSIKENFPSCLLLGF